jgi:hypothetical protein
MRKPFALIMVLAIAGSGSCIKVKADLDDADRDKILSSLAAEVDKLVQSLAGLERTIDEQREKLADDVEQLLAMGVVNLRALADQLQQSLRAVDVSITNFQERLTADLLGAITSLGLLTEQLRQGVHGDAVALIREVSRKLDEQREVTLHQVNAFVRETIRPTVAQLERSGDKLVGRVVLAANVLIVRIVGGLVAALAVLGLALMWRRLRGGRVSPIAYGGLATLGTIFLASFATATVLANPTARIGAPRVELPDGQAVCAKMSEQGRAFKAAVGGAIGRPPLRDDELPAAVLGGHRMRPADGGSTPPDLSAAAVDLRKLAADCATYDPSGTFVEIARDYITLAGAYLGERPRCTTDRDCISQGKRCDARTGECLQIGVLCHQPTDCAPGFQCDAWNRCVARASASCTTPNDCRPDDSCDPSLGRCVSSSEVETSQARCDVSTPGVFGPCKVGKLRSVERWVRCTQTVFASPEECDGIDNNCNNTTDEGLHRPEACVAPGATGECARAGTWSCGGTAGWTCTAARPATEVCDGKDNDCDGMVDDSVPSGGACADGVGECRTRATLACAGGVMRCTPAAPVAETCDGKDNDCDGKVDEGRVCCRRTTEVCDGEDNDCDGKIDEGNICDGDGPCGAGKVRCDCTGGCLIPRKCQDICDPRNPRLPRPM